jgi:hypothetical protein
MTKGFSSEKTEKLFNHIISQDLTGEQFCELANRLKEYGDEMIFKHKQKLIEDFMTQHHESIYDQMYV